MASEPLSSQLRTDLTQRCGRCRLEFPVETEPAAQSSTRWWLCPPCRGKLLGDKASVDARWK